MDDNLKKEIRKIALQNAVEHDGKTNDKVVLSKSLGTIPELRNNVKDAIPEIASIVSQVNDMSIEEQKTEIENNFPEILNVKKPVKKERVGLPPLEGAEQGKVVTRFTPAPNGYPHIGHAKAAIISEEYTKMYGGKLVLRFDDTNPEDTRLEYWAAIKVGLDWLGIKFDQEKNTTDDKNNVQNIEEKSITRKQAMRSSNFWIVLVAYSLASLTFPAVGAHTIPFLTDAGFERTRAAAMLSLFAFPGLLT